MKNLNVENTFLEPSKKILKKVRTNAIDTNIEEFGVRKTGGELVNYEEFDQLMKKSRRKKKKCKC